MAKAVTAVREVRSTLAALRESGVTAEYATVDLTDPEAVATVLAPYAGQVTGVVHGAGQLADRLIVDKTADAARPVFATKLAGLRNVLAAVPAEQLRHLVLFSSVAGTFGNRGQADYAMANEALTRIAAALAAPNRHVAALAWGAWAAGMVDADLAEMFRARGVEPIPVDAGTAAFVAEFGPDRTGGPAIVLGTDLAGPPAAETSTNHRTTSVTIAIDRLWDEGVIADHSVDGSPVLPATVVLGLMIEAVEREIPGPGVREVRDLEVRHGLVQNGTRPAAVHLDLAEDADGVRCTLRADGDDPRRVRYSAVLRRGSAPAGGILRDLPTGRRADGTQFYADGTQFYADGTLFHGPRLRGVRAVLADEPRLVLECALNTESIGAEGERYRPLPADLLLQAALVQARRSVGQAALPVHVDWIELIEPLPAGRPFLVVVDEVTTAGGTTRCRVTACDPDGRVLTRCTGVEVVGSPTLTFA
jgi:hypothetical protein